MYYIALCVVIVFYNVRVPSKKLLRTFVVNYSKYQIIAIWVAPSKPKIIFLLQMKIEKFWALIKLFLVLVVFWKNVYSSL